MNQAGARDFTSSQQTPPADIREKCSSLGFEILKRASEQKNFSGLCFYLVNDLRAFIEFDRCFLVFHLGGPSRVLATNHQPSLEKKSDSFSKMNELASGLSALGKGLLLSCEGEECDFGSHGIPDTVQSAIKHYTDFSGSRYFLCIPLMDIDSPVAHVVCEFFGDRLPNRLAIMALIEAAPLLTPTLLERWILEKKPSVSRLFHPEKTIWERLRSLDTRFWVAAPFCALIVAGLLLYFPVNYTVGGETTVVPWERRFAFCKMDGLIEKVLVKEGANVSQGDVLALLDPKDIHLKIAKTEREIDIMAKQIERLTREADKTPSKLGERKIAELERLKKVEELKFLRWQSQFLSIKSPLSGIVMTKDVDSLAGKRMSAGEPFCEVADPTALAAEVLVPDYKAALVKPKQSLEVYLNNNPLKSIRMEVAEIAPNAEMTPRHGNVCRVKGRFQHSPESVIVGMTGIGKIETEKTNLWSIIFEAIALRWNQLSLYI